MPTVGARTRPAGESYPVGVMRHVLLLIVLLGLGATAWLQPPHAAAGPVHPVTLELESLSVGVGFEHRLAVVHPIQRPKRFKALDPARPAATAQPDTLGLERTPKRRNGRYRLANLLGAPLLVAPGTLLRDEDRDWAIVEPALVSERTRGDLNVLEASVEGTPGHGERELLEAVVPPALRWDLLRGDRNGYRDRLAQWMSHAELVEGRRSPADLAESAPVAPRLEGYVRALASLGRAPDGLENVGYAAIVDGRVAALEVWSSADEFRQAWPHALRAVAVQSVVAEIEQQLPAEEELPAAANPDRYLVGVKAAMLELFGAKPKIDDLETVGESYLFPSLEELVAAAVVLDEDVRHLVALADPDARAEEPDDEDDFDPGVASRKLRPTAEEQRLLDRRRRRAEDGRAPPIPTPPVPPRQGNPPPTPTPPGPVPPPGD